MNPFQALDVQDDEDDFIQTPIAQKSHKKTHGQKKQTKEKKTKQNQKSNMETVNETIPLNVKENVKARNYKNPRPQKDITEGHTHDRRSGTGRHERPRKEGGGKGNLGNVKDELNKQKYIPAQQNQQTKQEQKKPEQPQSMTLDEYYKNRGVNINELDVKKEPPKKNEFDAQWIKKEKLTLMSTKEDEKKKDRNMQFNKRQYAGKVSLGDNLNPNILGFINKPKRQERREQQPKENRQNKQKKKQEKQKIIINEDDFPAL